MAGHLRSGVLERKYIFEYDVGLWTLGSVQVLRDRVSGELKTCKTVPKNRIRSPQDIVNRLRRLQELQHPHLCSVEEVLEDQSRYYIISDKCVGGDVAEWMVRVQEDGNWLQEQTVAEYVRQALIAIAHGHSNRVYHRDLRPSSLALTSKMPDAMVKVMDFGLASILDPEDAAVQKGPSPYTAPEVRTGFGRVVPSAPDVWSIGAIAHALLVGHPPSQDEAVWGVGAGGFLSRRNENDGWSERSTVSRDFVRRLLQQAGDRPTAARALQHPWLKGTVSLESAHWALGAETTRELQHKMLCYMTAVLLLPDSFSFQGFSQLRQAFAQIDADRDGLVARHFAHRLLKDSGVASEAAAAALDIVDVRSTDQLDLCATACAELITREFFPLGQLWGAIELAPRMLRRFFQSYGDHQQMVATMEGVSSKLCTATTRDIETFAGIQYDDVLAPFSEDGTIDAQQFASGLCRHGGRGTPLSLSQKVNDNEPDSSWGDALRLEGLGDFVTSVFQTCGLGNEKLRGYRSILGGR